MGKKSPKAPAAPDPVATAEAQTQTNKETALWNAALNNVNQITPYGTLTYTQTGGGPQYNMQAYNAALAAWNKQAAAGNTTSAKGGTLGNSIPPTWVPQYNNKGTLVGYKTASGDNVTLEHAQMLYGSSAAAGGTAGSAAGAMPQLKDFLISDDTPPQYTATIKLTPEQQAILNSTQANDLALSRLGGEQIGRIRDAVSTPYSYDSIGMQLPDAASLAQLQQQGQDAIMSRLNPQFSLDEEQLRNRLINQGIGQGSQAYQREMELYNQRVNDARQQAILGGQAYASQGLADAMNLRNQQIQEYDTVRNRPLNEYIGMTSGVQVQNPSFTSQNYGGMGNVDYAGLVQGNYNNQMQQYNAGVAQNNATMGGLFGLGGTLLGASKDSWLGSALSGLFSDIRLKENIKPAGEENGFPLYEFNYIGRPERRYVGVMAQDVEKVIPDAVKDVNGWKAVNYDMIGVKMREVSNG